MKNFLIFALIFSALVSEGFTHTIRIEGNWNLGQSERSRITGLTLYNSSLLIKDEEERGCLITSEFASKFRVDLFELYKLLKTPNGDVLISCGGPNGPGYKRVVTSKYLRFK